MHATRLFKHWADTHHLSVPDSDRVHDRAFWVLVALGVLVVAMAVLAVFVEVDPAILYPPNPYLDTYLAW